MTVQIRRGIDMYPVYGVPFSNVMESGDHKFNTWLNTEFANWLITYGLPTDPHSNAIHWWEDWEKNEVNFFFADPILATLFKLTWL